MVTRISSRESELARRGASLVYDAVVVVECLVYGDEDALGIVLGFEASWTRGVSVPCHYLAGRSAIVRSIAKLCSVLCSPSVILRSDS